MARARSAVRQGISANIRDLLLSTVSAVNGQTISCPELAHVSSNELNDSEVFVYAGTGAGQARRIQTQTQGTGVSTLQPYAAWTVIPDATSLVEISRDEYGWSVAKKNEAITQAHEAAKDIYLADVLDDTLTMQAGRKDYPIPSGFRYLSEVFLDHPADVGVPGSVYDSGALNWGSQFYDQDRGLSSISAQTRLSQGFYVTAGGNPNGFWCGGVALYLRTVGAPTASATLTARIETDTAGLPSGTLVDPDGTGTRLVSAVSATYGYVQFKFTAPIFLTSGQKLNVTLATSGAVDAANYVAWGEDTSTSYNRGNAGQYSGAVWSVIAGSALLFVAQTSQLGERFRSLPRDDRMGPNWRVNPVGANGELWIRDPTESARLRLVGQGQATAPVLDTDLVTLPEAFVVPKATSLLIAQMGSGPQQDSEARDRWAQFWDTKAEAQLPRMRTQVRPNSEPVQPR